MAPENPPPHVPNETIATQYLEFYTGQGRRRVSYDTIKGDSENIAHATKNLVAYYLTHHHLRKSGIPESSNRLREMVTPVIIKVLNENGLSIGQNIMDMIGKYR